MLKLKQKIYKLIRKHGKLTGSRAWKVHNKDSDYDYIVPEKIYHQLNIIKGIEKVIKFHDQKIDPDYDGNPTFYFEYRGRTINVISPVGIENEAWIWASECIKFLPFPGAIKDRNKRIEVFKRLRGFYIQNLGGYTGDKLSF